MPQDYFAPLKNALAGTRQVAETKYNVGQQERRNALADRQMGMQEDQQAMQMQKFQQEVLSNLPKTAYQIKTAPPQMQGQLYNSVVQAGGWDNVPQWGTPEATQIVDQLAGRYEQSQQPNLSLTETPEGMAYLPKEIKPGSEAPKPIKVEGIKSSEAIKAQEQALKDAKDKKVTDFKNANDLRDEYNTQSKTFVQVRDSYGRVLESSNSPSPAGDLALIFNYMKMLDPGSVVRESEFANAAATGAHGERIKAAVGKVTTGERLSDAMRQDFLGRSKMLFIRTKQNQGKLKSEYTRLANKFDVDPDAVIVDYSLQGQTEQAQPTGEIKFLGFE